MKKTFGQFLLCCLLFVFAGACGVYAAQQGNVYDDADLLTADEVTSVDSAIAALKEETGWNIYAVSTMDAQGKTAMQYADDFFDEQSKDLQDGVVLLIDMDNREIYLSTCGEAVRYLTDDRNESILDDAYTDVSNGDYSSCYMSMLYGVQSYYEKGIPRDQYNYDTETGKVSRHHSLTVTEILIAVLAAIAAGAITFFVIVGKYRLKFGNYKYAFRKFGAVQLSNSNDILVNTTVTHRRIPQDSGGSGGGGHSSGRSSVHTSSSGRSHGGSGRKF